MTNFPFRLSVNRKLFSDNNNLAKRNEEKDSEILELRDRIDELLQQNNRYFDEKNNLEKTLSSVNDVRASQKAEINKLVDDNQKLVKLAQDNEKAIKALELEKANLISRNDEANFELKNTSNKLKLKEENLSYTQRQLEDMKLANIKCQNTLKDYEMNIDNLRMENNNLNGNLQKEKILKNDSEKNGERLQSVLSEREREINRLLGELDDSKRLGNKLSDEKFVLESESQKLKNHIFILTEQNEKVENYLRFFEFFPKIFFLKFSFCLRNLLFIFIIFYIFFLAHSRN